MNCIVGLVLAMVLLCGSARGGLGRSLLQTASAPTTASSAAYGGILQGTLAANPLLSGIADTEPTVPDSRGQK